MPTDNKHRHHCCDKQTKMQALDPILSLVATQMATNTSCCSRRSFNPQCRPMLLASAHNINNNTNSSSNSKDSEMRKYFSIVWRMCSGQGNKLSNKPTPYVKGRGNRNASPVSRSLCMMLCKCRPTDNAWSKH